MGGTCYCIEGDIDEQLLEPVPLSRTFWDRLKRRTRFRNPDVIHELGGTLTTIEATELARTFVNELCRFVISRVDQPHEPTQLMLDYLKFAHHARIQKDTRQGNNNCNWEFQLFFRGGGGESETSAEVAIHWVELWFDAHSDDEIGRVFNPHGFFPLDQYLQEQTPQPYQFIPVNCNYVQRFSADTMVALDMAEVAGSQSNYEIDAAHRAFDDDGFGETTGAVLRDRFEDELRDNQCRCQVCMPSFDEIEFDINEAAKEYVQNNLAS